jgi:hypothetical protein
MEIVLLWLDEIDDLVFAALSVCFRVSYPGVAAALTAAACLNTLSLIAIA